MSSEWHLARKHGTQPRVLCSKAALLLSPYCQKENKAQSKRMHTPTHENEQTNGRTNLHNAAFRSFGDSVVADPHFAHVDVADVDNRLISTETCPWGGCWRVLGALWVVRFNCPLTSVMDGFAEAEQARPVALQVPSINSPQCDLLATPNELRKLQEGFGCRLNKQMQDGSTREQVRTRIRVHSE